MIPTLYDLYTELKTSGTYFFDYDTNDIPSVTLFLDGEYGIFLNTRLIDNATVEKRVIAHEMGHCATGTTHTIYSPYELITRYEYRAEKWAIKKLIPEDELFEAVHAGCHEAWELAEYFDVPQPFIEKALSYYENAWI